MSGVKRFVLGGSIILALAVSVFLLWVSKSHTTPILMYHIVSPEEEKGPNIVMPESFRYQMSFIKKRGFKVLSFDDYVRMRGHDRKIARRNILISFDDGHASLYDYVFPVLKKYGFPAIIYMPSGMVGEEGYLTREQIKEMTDSGLITFGSHTRNHVYLPDLSLEEQRNEIMQSKAELEAMLGKDVVHFSYPFGGFSEEIKSMLKEAGYMSAVTTNRGFDRYNALGLSVRQTERIL